MIELLLFKHPKELSDKVCESCVHDRYSQYFSTEEHLPAHRFARHAAAVLGRNRLALHRSRVADRERLRESFNGRMRDEFLNATLSFDMDDAH